jgi:hypothetical protein
MTALHTLAPVLIRTQKAHARSTAKDLRLFRDATQDPDARRLASARLLKTMHAMGITGVSFDSVTGVIAVGGRESTQELL